MRFLRTFQIRIAVLLVLALLFSMSVAYGAVDRIRVPPEGWNLNTPPENIFQAAGSDKTFILLEQADDPSSMFFILSQDGYGQRAYDPDNTQKFDPSDANNIAYWLNHDFISPDYSGAVLPSALLPYIDYERSWPTEGGHPNGNAPEDYVVTAGIVLLSQTEWLTHIVKFGVKDKLPGKAWWLRTGRGIGQPDSNRVLMSMFQAANAGQTDQTQAKDAMNIRPAFYLNRDFFRQVKLDTSTLGDNVKQAILAEYEAEELQGPGTADYSKLELGRIGYETGLSDEQIEVVLETELGGYVKPEAAQFKVDILTAGTADQHYTIEYAAPNSGSPGGAIQVTVKPGEKLEQTVDIQPQKNGIFTLEVVIKRDGEIVKTYTKPFTVMPAYEPQFMDEFTLRGFSEHYSQENRTNHNDTALAKRMGANTMRDTITWSKLELERGVYNFTRHDQWIPALIEEDILVIGALSYSNTKYVTPPDGATDPTMYAPRTQEAINAFAAYVEATLRHYPQIRMVEIWNEPNSTKFWKPTPSADEYNDLVKAASVAARKVNPDIQILGGAMSNTNTKWVKDMFDDGAYPYVDAISFHPYIYPESVDKGFQSNLQSIANMIYQYGGWKDVAITEVGWSTYNGSSGVTEDKQAIEMVKQFVVSDAEGIIANTFYELRNVGTNLTEKQSHFGIVKRDFSAKKGFLAYTQMSLKLGGALHMGELALKDSVKAHLYQKNGEPVLVLWSTASDTDYQLAGSGWTVEDLLGNPVAASGGTITIGNAPIYIEGLDASWFNKALSRNISGQYTDFLAKWKDRWPNTGLQAEVNQLKAYAASLENETVLPQQAAVEQHLNQHYGLGDDLLDQFAGGELPLSETELAQLLHDLQQAGLAWGHLLALSVDDHASVVLQSTARAGQINAYVQTMAGDGALQYAQEIARHMKELNRKAVSLNESPKTGKIKAGMLTNWDTISLRLSYWAEKMAQVESRQNIGVLLHIYSEDAIVTSGVAQNVQASVKNHLNRSITGIFKLYNESGAFIGESPSVTVAPEQTISSQIPVLLEYSNKKIENCFLKFYENETELAVNRVPFTIQFKMDAELSPAAQSVEDITTIKLKLQNGFNKRMTGSISVTPPEGWVLQQPQQSFDLAAAAESELVFQVSQTNRLPFNFYTFSVALTDGDGMDLLQKQLPLSMPVTVKNTQPVDIQSFDGDIGDWSDAYPVFINPPAQAGSSSAWFDSDIAGMIFTKWDEDYFYVLGNIFDNLYAQLRTGVQIWDGDSMQIAFDTLNTKSGGYDEDDYEYGFTRTYEGNEGYAWKAPGGAGGPLPEGWSAVLRDNGKHITRYLIKIPKSQLTPMPFAIGHQFGLNVAMNDSDFDSRERWAEITRGIVTGKNPASFYTWELKAPETPVPAELVLQYGLPIDLQITDDGYTDPDVNMPPPGGN